MGASPGQSDCESPLSRLSTFPFSLLQPHSSPPITKLPSPTSPVLQEPKPNPNPNKKTQNIKLLTSSSQPFNLPILPCSAQPSLHFIPSSQGSPSPGLQPQLEESMGMSVWLLPLGWQASLTSRKSQKGRVLCMFRKLWGRVWPRTSHCVQRAQEIGQCEL